MIEEVVRIINKKNKRIYFVTFLLIILSFVLGIPTFLTSLFITIFIMTLIVNHDFKRNCKGISVVGEMEQMDELLLGYKYNHSISSHIDKLESQIKIYKNKVEALKIILELDFETENVNSIKDILAISDQIMVSNVQRVYKRIVIISTESDVKNDDKEFLNMIIANNENVITELNNMLIAVSELKRNKEFDISLISDFSAAIAKLNEEEQ